VSLGHAADAENCQENCQDNSEGLAAHDPLHLPATQKVARKEWGDLTHFAAGILNKVARALSRPIPAADLIDFPTVITPMAILPNSTSYRVLAFLDSIAGQRFISEFPFLS
jgi:hypothetical protein